MLHGNTTASEDNQTQQTNPKSLQTFTQMIKPWTPGAPFMTLISLSSTELHGS